MKKLEDPFDLFFERIYSENYMYLVKYLYLLVNDLGFAEDYSQIIFLRILKAKKLSLTGANLRNYLRKAAKHIAVDHLRKVSREDSKNKHIIPEVEAFDEKFYKSIENNVIDGEVLATVHDVLEEFSEKSRKIFIARLIDNKPRRQVSEEEKISSYNIKKIEEEILLKLREKLKQYL